MLIEPVVELILKNTESNDDVVVLIEPVVELILKNTLSNDDVVVLIEPVVELICLFTKSCEDDWVFIEPVTELIPLLTKSWDAVCTFNWPVPIAEPFNIIEPVVSIEPVNVWVSSLLLPNKLEPLSNIIEADVISVKNSCAVILPATTKVPPIVVFPVIVWLPMNVFEPVVALYAVTNLLKFSMFIWFVFPRKTKGITVFCKGVLVPTKEPLKVSI